MFPNDLQIVIQRTGEGSLNPEKKKGEKERIESKTYTSNDFDLSIADQCICSNRNGNGESGRPYRTVSRAGFY
jgi:hypothetical protein